jgi:hypothetical protein
MKMFAALLLCLTPFAWSSSKPEPAYQDAVLKDFRFVQQGQHCRTNGGSTGTVNANTDDSGYTNGSLNSTSSSVTNCSPNMVALYTITIGEHEFVLTPRRLPFSGSLIAAPFRKNSDLAGLLPGTGIKIRSEGDTFYVKVGKRESAYKIVSMK